MMDAESLAIEYLTSEDHNVWRAVRPLLEERFNMTNFTTYSEADALVPALLWLPLEEVEPGALDQIRAATRHPDVAESLHVAVMPDCHVGYGVTIGSVVPTYNSVIPNAVGVDIGCGMCAVNTGIQLTEEMGRDFWRAWAGQVMRDVPVGFSAHKVPQDLGDLERPLKAKGLQSLIEGKAAYQLGTLGGGNHFMEAQADETGHIWLMVHSGSRHTGLKIANHYHKLAIEQSAARGLHRVIDKDLSSLRLDFDAGQDYLHDMLWAEEFALKSRLNMLTAMHEALLGMDRPSTPLWFEAGSPGDVINIHHNFAALETHDGVEVMVHRKGATQAQDGQLGIIPGSMGTSSYIVRGKGSPASLESCSHGAGRRMGRKAAKREFTTEQFAESLQGTHSKASGAYLDESPMAYKDIDTVIGRQLDLIDIVHALKPIMTVKGDSKSRED